MSYKYDRKQMIGMIADDMMCVVDAVLQGSRPPSHRAGAVECGIGILALAVLVACCHPASALDCAAAKSGTDYWSWRLIAGKRCWYPGRGKIDKARLRWGTAAAPEDIPLSPAPAHEGRPANLEEALRAYGERLLQNRQWCCEPN